MSTLQELLKANRFSVNAFSAHTGLSRSAISRAVKGKPVFKNTFKTICRELNVSPDDVTGVQLYSTAGQPRKKRQ